MPAPTLTYTSVTDFEAYVEGWETTDPDALARLLSRAERDVDNVLGVIATIPELGLKYDPSLLADWEAEALSRAVCAQAEWRFRAGGTTADPGTPSPGLIKRIKGPDFEQEYTAGTAPGFGDGTGSGLYGPRVALELKPISHLRGLVARIGPRRWPGL